MATSGTWNFSLTNAEVVQSAYALCHIRRPQLVAEHMVDARVQLNLLLSSWSNLQVNLFNVDLVTVPCVAGTATYAVDPKTIMILDMYLNVMTGNPSTDQLMTPISRDEYASYTNKNETGTPTVFWFNRLINPTVTLWLVPDGNAPSFSYYRVTQNQDANLVNGETPAVPYRWLDALTTGLAARLAKIYAPALEDKRAADAKAAWDIAATQDIEDVPMYILPTTDAYYR